MMIKTVNLGELISPAKVRRCNDDEYPVLSMTMHDGIVLQSERFKKSLASLDQSNYKVVSRGQLVVGFPIDEGVIYVQNAADEGIMSPAYGVWDIHAEKVLPEYLECCLHSPQSMSYYMSKLKGTTARRRSITTEDLLSLPISLPDKSEQRRRLSLLSSCKDTISKSEQQLAKLDELVKSRFVEMFIGKGYPTKTVDEVSLTKGEYGAQSASVEYDPTRPRYVRITDINDDGTLNDDVVASINPADDEQYKLVYGDFMFARMGATVGKTYAFIEGNQIFAGYLIRYRLNREIINPRYLFWYTRLDEYWNWVKLNQSGAAQPGINAKKYGSLQIPLPPIDEQEQFATFVEQTDKSKLAVKQSLEKLETLKKSLMQQYFG